MVDFGNRNRVNRSVSSSFLPPKPGRWEKTETKAVVFKPSRSVLRQSSFTNQTNKLPTQRSSYSKPRAVARENSFSRFLANPIGSVRDYDEEPQEPTSSLNSKLLRLAKQKRFDEMIEMLLQKNGQLGSSSNTLCRGITRNSSIEISQKTAETSPLDNDGVSTLTRTLHQILEYRPPFAAVDLLCNYYEVQEKQCFEDTDGEKGRRPLHTAVSNNCDLTTIKRLMKGKDQKTPPAMAADYDGRLPLHIACCSSKICRDNTSSSNPLACAFNISRSKSRELENMTLVIYELLQAYPRGAITQDSAGNTPLDLARRVRADPNIIIALLTVKNDLDKEKKKSKRKKSKRPTLDREPSLQSLTEPASPSSSSNIDLHQSWNHSMTLSEIPSQSPRMQRQSSMRNTGLSEFKAAMHISTNVFLGNLSDRQLTDLYEEAMRELNKENNREDNKMERTTSDDTRDFVGTEIYGGDFGDDVSSVGSHGVSVIVLKRSEPDFKMEQMAI